MAAFRWIQMVLLLILMLQFIAQTETQETFLTVRGGDNVTLPCGNRRDTNDESDETAWLFNDRHTFQTKTLVELGNSHIEMKTISDRLSVTANGFLLLHNVTEEDVGRYACRWMTSGTQHVFVVYLSLITMVEQQNPEKVTLFCSVLQYDVCLHEVKWLYEGKEEKPSDMEISQHSCSATVTFPTFHQKLDICPSLTCKITNSVTKAVQLLPCCPQSSEETQSTPTATHHWTPAWSNNEEFFYWLRWIVVSVGLAAVVMSVVILNLWLKTKGNKQNEQNLECNDEDEEEGVEIYEN